MMCDDIIEMVLNFGMESGVKDHCYFNKNIIAIYIYEDRKRDVKITIVYNALLFILL